MNKLTKYQKLERLTMISFVSAGLLFEYYAISVIFPARVIDKAWRDHIVQVCENLKPRCQSISFEKATVNNYWIGVQVNAKATPASIQEVHQALLAAEGNAARRFVSLAVSPGKNMKKS